MRSYRTTYFDLRELVTPEIHTARGSAAWELLDPRALRVLDQLREKFGPTIVNNWHKGGAYRESGLRPSDTKTGARYSQHKTGRAFDCKFMDTTPQAVYAYVREHTGEFPEITVLEDIEFTPTWLHFDVRNADWPGIKVVRP